MPSNILSNVNENHGSNIRKQNNDVIPDISNITGLRIKKIITG